MEKQSQERNKRIEELIDQIESVADPSVRAGALELVQSLMDLHGEGLSRLLEIVAEDPSGLAIIDRLGRDEVVGSLLILYGLHPDDLQSRVQQALDKVRPYLKSHGGNVSLTGVEDGVVRLQLEGSCHGCASSALTMKLAIEDAIYAAAPDLVDLIVEGVVESPKAPALVPLQVTRSRAATAGAGWLEVDGVTTLTQGAAQTIEVGGLPVLFCRLNSDYYAYTCSCSNCGAAMSGAQLESTTLSCPKCGERFDVVQAGRSLDSADLQLQPFPLLLENGLAKIALPRTVNN